MSQERSVLAGLSQFLSSPRLSPRVVVYGATSVLLTGLVTVSVAATAPSPTPNGGASSGAVEQRESLLAAQIAARNSGQRVEVTGLRTETATTYANTNGTTTTETAAAPIRVRDNSGKWTPVDLHLVASGGHYVPKAAAAGLTLSLGGNDGLAGVTRKGKHLTMKWAGTLPQPTVDGATATYPDVDKDVDLVMQATRLGYGQSFRVKARPSGQLVYRLPLALPGITVTEQPDGGYKLTDATGAVVGVLTRPLMWDAKRDPVTGDPINTVQLDAKIVTSAAGTVLQVKPDKAFLDNPTTQYPVTLDPDTHLGIVQDTWVASNTSVGYPTATDLRSGKYSGTSAVQRSFIQFGQLPASGVIQSATLALYNNQSAGCDSTKQTRVYQVASPGFSSSTNYANRPGVMSSPGYVTTTGSYAGTGCTAAGWLRWDVTSMVANWNAGGGNYGFQVLAADETDTANWKRYASADNGNNLYVPSLAVTYDNYPDTPKDLSVSGSVSVGGVNYVRTTVPQMNLTGCDTDGGTVQPTVAIYDSTHSNAVSTNNSSYVTQCSPTNVRTIANVLQDGAYTWRAKTTDGTLESSWTDWQSFTVDTTPPPAPTYTPTTSSGSNYTFHWSSPPGSDVVAYRYGIDDQNPPTTGTNATSLTMTVSDAAHTLHVLAVDRAGNTSTVADLPFNQSETTVTSPKDAGRTAKTVVLAATSHTGWTDVTFRYRKLVTDAWTDIPSGPNGDVRDSNGDHVTFPAPAINGGAASPTLNWDMASTLGRVDGGTLVQACFHDPNGSSCSPVTPTVTLDQKGLGDSYATADVGPGTVSLITGNLSVQADDVADGSGTTSLTVTRTFNSRTPNDPTDGMFGPGWLGSLPTDSAGSDYVRLIDNATSVVVTTSDGSPITFLRYTDPTTQAVSYAPSGDDTGSGMTLSPVCPTGFTGSCYTVSDVDGNKTTFQTNSGATYQPRRVTQPGGQQVQYTYDSHGWLTQALAQPPVNASCTNSADTTKTAWTAGCRALEPVYDLVTGHVSKIQLAATNADGSLLRVDVSCYAYEPGTGRLHAQWDPRLGSSTSPPTCTPADADAPSSNLVTTYTYDATTGRLSTVTPPGLAGFTMTYDSNGRLDHVDRAHGTAGTGSKETTSVVYELPLSPDIKDASLRPDLRPASTTRWAQTDQPVTASAVFGPGDAASTSDLRNADVTYIDADGHAVNTASYADGWHLTTTEYDSTGNVRRTLTAANRELALNPTSPEGAALALLPDTAQNARWLDTTNLYSTRLDPIVHPGADQTVDLTDVYGPFHLIAQPGGGARLGREHTHIGYDTGSEPGHPAGGSLHLETSRTVAGTSDSSTSPVDETDARTTTTEYSLGTGSLDDNAGWDLHAPMRVTENSTGTGTAKRVTVMRYDHTTGLMTEKWMPQATASGADAAKTKTVYFSATSTDPDCANPSWGKLPCKIMPVAQPTTVGVPPVPVTSYTYDYLLRPATVIDTVTDAAGTVLARRTTTTSYDNNGWATRPVKTSITSTEGVTVPDITRTYDAANGLPTTITSSATPENAAGTITIGHDDFGRQTSYTDADGNQATTNYNATTGRVDSEQNARGTISYTYRSGNEHRDMPTGMTVIGLAGQFTANYDADGQLASQQLPNGLTEVLARDTAGQLTKLEDSVAGQSAKWLTDTVTPTVHGQWTDEHATASSRTFTYDGLGRLTAATDTPTTADATPTTCTTRTYSYDADSNRLDKKQKTGAPGAGCPALPLASSDQQQSHSYDAADRLLNAGTDSGLAYDNFGRVKTLPAADAGASGEVTNTYYGNDLVRAQTIGDPANPPAVQWTLDPQLRPRGVTDNTAGASVSKTTHYDDGTDSASWIDETQPPGSASGSTWTRYIAGFDGNLTVTQTTAGGFTYQLTNLHGDIAATAAEASTTGADSFLTADEFGNPNGSASLRSTGDRYGWLGGKQRSNETAGNLVLMGVRLYAPTLGRFLQTDPVPGGSANSYDYATQDPINNFDLAGQMCFGLCKKIKNHFKKHWRGYVTGIAIGLAVVGTVGTLGVGGAGFIAAAAWASRAAVATDVLLASADCRRGRRGSHCSSSMMGVAVDAMGFGAARGAYSALSRGVTGARRLRALSAVANRASAVATLGAQFMMLAPQRSYGCRRNDC